MSYSNPTHDLIYINFYIRRKNPLELDLSQPVAPLSYDVWSDQYSAAPHDLNQVEIALEAYGLQIIKSDPAHRVIIAAGRPAQFEVLFQTSFHYAPHIDGNYYHYMEESNIVLPDEIKGLVVGILGHDTRQRHRRHNTFSTQLEKQYKDSVTPSEVAKAYNFPTTSLGEGQTIAILELGGGYQTKALQHYFSEMGIESIPNIRRFTVDGAQNNTSAPATEEIYLDIEIIASIARKADIQVWFTNEKLGIKGIVDGIQQIISHNSHNIGNLVISYSWGGPEISPHGAPSYSLTPINEALKDAASMGVTICASAGDHGSNCGFQKMNGHPPYDPKLAYVESFASNPHALACGGTTLHLNDDSTIKSEVVWNDGNNWGTGGGVSAVYAVPAYQSGAGLDPKTINDGHAAGRGVPDVCGNADPKTGYLVSQPALFGTQQIRPVGGTSAVAPLWAALIAIMNGTVQKELKRPIGFINPLLYKLERSAFNDITEGNNGTYENKGYEAAEGWDQCTGLGSPNGTEILNQILAMLKDK